MKKCRPVVKEPSGGTLLFRCALPARGASVLVGVGLLIGRLCLGAACTGCIRPARCGNRRRPGFASALPARGASVLPIAASNICSALPRRYLHGVHRYRRQGAYPDAYLCLGATCTGCIHRPGGDRGHYRLCLGATCTGCIRIAVGGDGDGGYFASALPARGASALGALLGVPMELCLGATCTGCIGKSRQIAAHHFVAYAVSR